MEPLNSYFFKSIRIKNNFSLKHISQKTNIELSYLSKLENYKIIPNKRIIKRLLKFYHIDEKDYYSHDFSIDYVCDLIDKLYL